MLGQTLGNYRVLCKLGEGGMGAVYLAEHTVIQRKVAIKVLSPDFLRQEDVVDRFFEARVCSDIHHPGIVQVFDCGQHTDGSAYLVMEYLRGEPLDARLRRLRRLPVLEAVRITRHCASALAAAHAAGVIHRDLKPGNIFLVPDPQVEGGERAKVLDFGIAKTVGDKMTSLIRTRTGNMIGTPVYMSPEQCRGAGTIDHRSDIYALGCLLFRMVCGRPPFIARGVGDIIASHLREAPPRPRAFAPWLPDELEALILATLAKDPADRVPTMAALAERLKELEPAAAAVRDDEALPADLGMGGDGVVEDVEVEIAEASCVEPPAPVSQAAAGDDWAAPPSSATRPLRSHRLTPFEDERHVTTLGGAASQRLRRARRTRRLGIAAVAALLAAAGVAIALIARPGAPEPDRAGATGARDAVVPSVTPLPAAEQPELLDEISVAIDSVPSGAVVYYGAHRLGETPLTYTAAAQPGPVQLTLRHKGYRSTPISFPGDRSDSIRVTLVPQRRGRGSSGSSLDDELLSR